MYGWRGRVGCVYPAVVAENIFTNFFKMAPEGVSLALRTCNTVHEFSDYAKESATQELITSVDLLAQRKVDIIIMAGSPIFNNMGMQGEADFLKMLSDRAGVEVTTTPSTAVVAMKEMGYKKVALAAPYDAQRTTGMAAYLEERGIGIGVARGFRGSGKITELHDIPIAASYRHIRDTFNSAPDVDAIYTPGMQFPMPDVPTMENDFGVPVVFATHALVWYAMRQLKINDPKLAQHGRLFQR